MPPYITRQGAYEVAAIWPLAAAAASTRPAPYASANEVGFD
jgi:hypothetical protein